MRLIFFADLRQMVVGCWVSRYMSRTYGVHTNNLYPYSIYMNTSLLFPAFLYSNPSSWSNLNSMNLDISISCFPSNYISFIFQCQRFVLFKKLYTVLFITSFSNSSNLNRLLFFRFGLWFIILLFVLNYSSKSTI